MPEPRRFLITLRVADSCDHAKGAVRTPCSVCSADCWVSPASAEAAGAEAIVVCLGCAPETVPGTAVLRFTEGQAAEVLSHFANGQAS